MYCSQCGAEAHGNFWSKCGAPLKGGGAGAAEQPADWSNEINYEALLRVPEVRELISKHAALAKKRMSGEEFLKLCEKAFIPAMGISIAKVASIVQPIYTTLGIKTGKTRSQLFPKPPGKVLVALLCSLARNSRRLRQVKQAEDGCMFEAAIPSDLWSFEGDLLVTVQRQDNGTFVEAATRIKGQLYDWGKSKRCLDQVFADLDMTPAL